MPLQTQSSIVDLLKSRGLPSDLNFRSQLYESIGLGTKQQFLSGAQTGQSNIVLLQRLNQSPQLLDQISSALKANKGLQGVNFNQPATPPITQTITQPTQPNTTLPQTIEDINQYQLSAAQTPLTFDQYAQPVLSQSYQTYQKGVDLMNQLASQPQKTVQDIINEQNQIREAAGLPALEKEYTDYLAKVEQVEKDIRDEVKQSGGIVTESQVRALALERTNAMKPQLTALESQLKLKQDLADKISEQYKVSQTEATQRAENMITNYFNLAKTQSEQEDKLKTSLTPAIYLQIAANPQQASNIIQSYSTKYGIEPSVLYSGLVTYKTEQDKQNILNAKNTADLLAMTKQGGMVNVPGVGDITVLGKRDDAPTTITANGTVHYWQDDQWVDTGMKADVFTPANLISALSAITNSQDPSISSALSSLLKKEGININIGSNVIVDIPENTLAARNNNPGNLKYAEQEGAAEGENGFARFNTPEEGYQALVNQIELDKSRNLTVTDFVTKYAPPTENDTKTYIKQLTSELGVSANASIKNIDTQQLAEFISKKESGTTITPIESDIKTNARALVEGTLVPTMLPGLGANKAKTIAEANRISMKETGKPYNATEEQIKYNAALKFSSSLNSSQMVRFKGLALSVVNTIDEVSRLANELKLSGIVPLNKVKLEAQRNLLGNTPKGQLVSQYLGAVNTLKEEFANLAQGGYAPTEATWDLANKQINENYGVDQLNASLKEVQKLINYRVQSFSELTPTYASSSGIGSTKVINGVTYVKRDDGKWYKQ